MTDVNEKCKRNEDARKRNFRKRWLLGAKGGWQGRETRSSQMGSPEYSSYELKSIISALFAGLLGVLRAVEEQQEAGVAVSFVGGVVVDAAGMGGGDVASG